MPDPRRHYRTELEPTQDERDTERQTIRPPLEVISRDLRDTVPDGRPARRAPKSGVRARRSRNAVTEIDASSHHNDPRREREDD